MDKIYHIYAKEDCLYNNLSEAQFKSKWETLKGMVGLLHTDYQLEDLSYESIVKSYGVGGTVTNTEPEGSDSY